MGFWPGLDRWPPPKEVWIAAAVVTFVVTPLLILMGIVGQIIYGAMIVIGVVLSMRLRLKQMNGRTQEFWRSGPDD